MDFNGWFVNGVVPDHGVAECAGTDNDTGIPAKGAFRHMTEIRLESPDNVDHVVFFVEYCDLVIVAPFGAAVFTLESGGGGGFKEFSMVSSYDEFVGMFRTGDKDALPDLWDATKAMFRLTAHADANYFKEGWREREQD